MYDRELWEFKGFKLHFFQNTVLEDDPPVHVHSPGKIKRKQVGVVVLEPETKEYKIAFNKRRLFDNFVSVPYGYESFIYLFLIHNYI